MNEPTVGGYYAYRVRRGDLRLLFGMRHVFKHAYRVVKVWAVDEQGAWLAVYGDLFRRAPVHFDPANLTVWFATLPLAHRSFEKLRAECILTGTVQAEETEGWEIAHGDQSGFGYITVTPDRFISMMNDRGFAFPVLGAKH